MKCWIFFMEYFIDYCNYEKFSFCSSSLWLDEILKGGIFHVHLLDYCLWDQNFEDISLLNYEICSNVRFWLNFYRAPRIFEFILVSRKGTECKINSFQSPGLKINQTYSKFSMNIDINSVQTLFMKSSSTNFRNYLSNF